ncbi:MAG: glycosyl hydrolase family 43 [Clostridia bacterium]|nr:glycosyl hydrolase family 43 [Clostridia bacterium]
MKNISFNDFINADFQLYEKNPIIKNPKNSFVIADPSVLTPENSHDKRWHLFCHTFFGVYVYSSDDGINFKKNKKIVSNAMRPDINYINGKYYLFFEKTRPVIFNLLSLVGAKWKSAIYCTESEDLVSWTEPHLVIGKTRPFEEDKRGIAISNPFLIENENGYRLYYSCGQTFIKDCGFCEPTHINFAQSQKICEGYVSNEKPIISPDKEKDYLNLCSGCLKVYRLKDCYIGLQNGIFQKEGKSYSAIMLLRSNDGINFEFIKPFLVPQKTKNSNWMAQYVYACCLTYHQGVLRLYFNARNVANNLQGRESIGIFEANLGEK